MTPTPEQTPLHIAEEVAAALADGRAVVALESTIISHGFPFPANIECALETENRVRAAGAVPATIAVIGGVPTVGISEDQIRHLGTVGAAGVVKASRRDLAVLSARGTDGATTVAGTMVVAALAGIRVFATGGIGGVHRGAQRTFDISADLLELARTPVCVVCAGAKSILDIGLTLEVLETHGVAVIGYKTSTFPAFYTRDSGFTVDVRIDSPREIAAVLRAHDALGLSAGTVVANPIAVEHAIDAVALDEWTDAALSEAQAAAIHGKGVTPFLLARLHALSDGATEEANKELVYSNAALAARIAVEVASLG